MSGFPDFPTDDDAFGDFSAFDGQSCQSSAKRGNIDLDILNDMFAHLDSETPVFGSTPLSETNADPSNAFDDFEQTPDEFQDDFGEFETAEVPPDTFTVQVLDPISTNTKHDVSEYFQDVNKISNDNGIRQEKAFEIPSPGENLHKHNQKKESHPMNNSESKRKQDDPMHHQVESDFDPFSGLIDIDDEAVPELDEFGFEVVVGMKSPAKQTDESSEHVWNSLLSCISVYIEESPQILSDLAVFVADLSDDEAEKVNIYIRGILEMYRVVCRIKESMSRSTSYPSTIAIVSTIQRNWDEMLISATTLSPSKIDISPLHSFKSFLFLNDDRFTSNCNLCKLPAVDPSVSIDISLKTVHFQSKVYHCTCINVSMNNSLY